jgi:Mn2+/Fe2+ NRAMP family transporter
VFPPRPKARHAVREALADFGPEVLTAASDNDPTNVGAAAIVGAQTGYQLSWVALLVAPLLGVVLTIAAQLGIVTRSDLQSLVLEHYGRWIARVLLVSVVLVNLVTMAADLQAGAAGIGLLAGVEPGWIVLPLGLALVGLLLIGKYDEVVSVLRFVLFGFLAFGVAAILAHPDWSRVLSGSLRPTVPLRHDDFANVLALLGTTLTAYVYLWETITRGVDEPHADQGGAQLARARVAAVVGSIFTALILWFMLVTFAATLGRHDANVTNAQDAARALRPVAGPLAADFFAIGLITSAVVALPVLMATTAHVVGAEFDWRRGLSERIGHARGFYAVLAASIGLAIAVDAAGIPLLTMLVAASIIGGLATPIGIILMVRLARDPQVMGGQPVSAGLAMAGWAVAAVVGGFGLAYVAWGLLGQF